MRVMMPSAQTREYLTLPFPFLNASWFLRVSCFLFQKHSLYTICKSCLLEGIRSPKPRASSPLPGHQVFPGEPRPGISCPAMVSQLVLRGSFRELHSSTRIMGCGRARSKHVPIPSSMPPLRLLHLSSQWSPPLLPSPGGPVASPPGKVGQ